MKRLGYIPMERDNLRSAYESVKESIQNLKSNSSILIFPEGTRSSDGNLNNFKRGGLNMLLRQKGACVLPVAIIGSINVLKKNSILIHPGREVELHILQPVIIDDKKTNKNKYDMLIEEIENRTRAAISSSKETTICLP